MAHNQQFDRRGLLKMSGTGLFGLGAAGLFANTARAGAPPRFLPASPERFDMVDCLQRHRLSLPLTPSSALGPYYVAGMPNRSNITEGKVGLPLKLFYMVVDNVTEQPIPGATVDIWHADACGIYSGFAAQGTAGQTFLRGVQTTDANGLVVFDTIFPGWYTGRTAHIHARIRETPTSQVLTTQFFFDDLLGYPGFGVNDAVYTWIAPYAVCGAPQTTNGNDGIYNPSLSQIVVIAGDGTFGLWAGIVISV